MVKLGFLNYYSFNILKPTKGEDLSFYGALL